MIKIEDRKILANNTSKLKDLSWDHNDNYYMTESTLIAVNFDAVKDEYIKDLKLIKKPKSNDAIFFAPNGKQVFIEFKNSSKDDIKKYDIRKKIYDSLLIYTDIINKGINYTREQMDYILVYNEYKSNIGNDDPKTNVQDSRSRDRIAKGFSKFGGTSYVKFGLEIFRNYCFKEIYTYSESEFEDFIKNGH